MLHRIQWLIYVLQIYKREEPAIPREVLSRGAEAICRRGQAQKLSTHIKERNKGYLQNEMLPLVEKDAGNAIEVLRVAYRHWRIWNEQVVLLPIQFY